MFAVKAGERQRQRERIDVAGGGLLIEYGEYMIHLRSIEMKPGSTPESFPFTVPIIRNFEGLEFRAPITFLVGENGSGKSTLLEAVACATALPAVGSQSVTDDPTLADVRKLADHFRLVWNKRMRRGFFMRAEDFFGFAKRMDQIRSELEQNLTDIEDEYKGRSKYAKDLARAPHLQELGAMRQSYGEGLDAHSHGEGFLRLFQQRFMGEGLYLLDEPEAPLSPMRQLTFLALMRMVEQRNGQMIIATHSPILLAYPGAVIISCDGGKLQEADYETLEHVQITRTFLNNPDQYLRHLFS